MRKSARASAIRAASPVPVPVTDAKTRGILDTGMLAEAPEVAAYPIQGFRVTFNTLLRVGDETVRVTNLASRRVEYPDGSLPIQCCLLMDEAGRFYGFEMEEGPDETTNPKVLARLADGKQAMQWMTRHLVWSLPLQRQFQRAIENPVFEFYPMLPESPKRRKRAAKRQASPRPLAIQLELATALVAVIRGLEANPHPEALAEARRNVSQLHRDLHSKETFKAVANG